MVTVALAQLRVDDTEQVDARVERVVALLSGMADVPDLVVLPELWPVGAFNIERILQYAEPLHGPFTTAMASVARTLRTTLHAGSFPERHGGGVSNTSVVFGPDGTMTGVYRKIHLFGFDQGEAALLAAGADTVVVSTPLGPTGITTCYDLRFPELYRALLDSGAEAFVVPAGWPLARIGHWQVLARARAVENLAPVVACNAVGANGGTAMGGSSLVVAADGVVIAQGSADQEEFVRARLDPQDTVSWRATFPALADRRMD